MLREGRSGFPSCNPDSRKALSQFKLNIAAEAAARVCFRERSADCCFRGRGSAFVVPSAAVRANNSTLGREPCADHVKIKNQTFRMRARAYPQGAPHRRAHRTVGRTAP